MIYDFINTLLNPFGYSLPPFDALCGEMSMLNNWWEVLRPDILISWLFYVAFAYGMLYFCFILPFRMFKRIIKAPDKKGH